MDAPFEGCEPEAARFWKNKNETTETQAATVSIAISLKRIADAINYTPVGNANIFDFIREISEKNSF